MLCPEALRWSTFRAANGSVFERRVPAVAGAMAVAALLGVSGCSSLSGDQLPASKQAPKLSDDCYYYQGHPVRLARSQTEFVLGVAEGVDASRLLQGYGIPATALTVLTSRGRRFHRVNLDAATPDVRGECERIVESLRTNASVWFVGRVFYVPADRSRVVPTDEIIVKLKAGVTVDGIATVLAANGLRIESRLIGTSDEYILRLTTVKNADVLRLSRNLHETGLFVWAEPNFIQEVARR